MTRVDTNYIIRYLVNDHKEMATIAEKVIMYQNVYISNEVLAEVVYVLHGVYGYSREEISSVLLELIEFDNIETSDKSIVLNAFKIYATKKLDFVDCLLCAYATIDEILTFDKKLMKCVSTL